MAPPDTERVTRRVGIHLKPFLGIEIVGFVEQPRTASHCVTVRFVWILDVQVQVDLLCVSVRPIGLNMIRSQLNTQEPAALGIENAVERVVGVDPTVEHPRPERAHSIDISCIEHDHVSLHSHRTSLADQQRPRHLPQP